MKKIFALILSTLLISTAVLTGCGSQDNKNTTDQSSSNTAETTQDSTSEKSDKVWIIATDTVFKPFEYTNENNEFVGIDVDLLAAIAEDQGFKYELQSLGWDAAVAAVQAGQADGLIAGATIKQEW